MFSTLLNINFSVWATIILSSANALILVKAKILSSGKELSLYNTVTTSDAVEDKSKSLKEKKKLLVTTIFLVFQKCFLPFERQV